ncbi:MFS transporter [Geobacillus sp. C56-T2]|uniref:MFS transporter n=1 Tax=Geobacillus sp. C56-T2 TaxID=600773 RepID=UPI0011A430E6|nr:MFS transporter [Geobacillus sp. C56-T2]NNV05115.1 MFS transporter [Geobacillus sp. MMMUD3]TWG29825.1 ACDE family multidrug resistance protein [Geobacillus sp. C56-T2]
MEWTMRWPRQAGKRIRRGWGAAALASIPLVMTLGNSMLIPVLPVMERQLGITPLQSSLLITMYSVVAILFIPLTGYASDRIGRKNVIIPSLLLAAAGGAIAGWTAWRMDEPYGWIMAGRMLQGLGAAGAFPVVLPLVGDLFPDEEEASRYLGTVETANTFGKVLSPILGAMLAGIVWFLPFFSFPVFCLLSAALMVWSIQAPVHRERPLPFRDFAAAVKVIFHREGRWLAAVFAIGGLLMLVLFAFLFFLSSRLEEVYHIDGVRKGWVLAIPLGALCFASFVAGRLIGGRKERMKWGAVAGCVLSAAALLLVPVDSSLFLWLALFSAAGIGIGIALPCLDALITEGIEKKERGTVTSVYSSLRFIGVAAGPPLAAWLMNSGVASLLFLLSALALVGGGLAFWLIHPEMDGGKENESGDISRH